MMVNEYELEVRTIVQDLFNQLEGNMEDNAYDEAELIGEQILLLKEELLSPLIKTQSFKETGVLSNNEGLTIFFKDGSEYQLTIVKSK